MQERAEAAMTDVDLGARTLAEIKAKTAVQCAGNTTKEPAPVAPTKGSRHWTASPRPYPTPTHTPPGRTAAPPTITSIRQLPGGEKLQGYDPGLYRRIQSIPWVQDGIDQNERQVVTPLLELAASGETQVARELAKMPFLQSPEPHDASALKSIRRMATGNPARLGLAFRHPALRQGITDQWTPAVAVIGNPSISNADALSLLDPQGISISLAHTETPLAGKVQLAVVRAGKSKGTKAVRILEQSVRAAERFMAVPFPKRSVILFFGAAVTGSPDNAAANYDSHIAVKGRYDAPVQDPYGHQLPQLLAHEVAHYYWNSNDDWIDEGMADLTASIALYLADGTPVETTNQPCFEAKSLRELAGLQPDPGTPAFRCNYALGERFFVNMLRTVGDVRFRAGMRALYRRSRAAQHGGEALNVSHLREIFGAEPGAEAVIRRWYHGAGPHDASRVDRSPTEPEVPEMNGRIEAVYTSATPSGKPQSEFSSSGHEGWIHLVIHYSHDTAVAAKVPVAVVEYYEDGFQNRRYRYSINARPDYTSGRKSISVGLAPGQRKRPGRYWAMIYAYDRKIGQAGWTVTP